MFMNWFRNKYPYTDFHELNLDFVLSTLMEMDKEIQNFIIINKIKYADPFQWSITSQYEANTLVIDPASGIVYLSVKAVPSGVDISNTDFWTPVFNLMLLYGGVLESISSNNEGSNTNASHDYKVGDWLWLNGRLYIVSIDIAEGTTFLIDNNIKLTNIEDECETIYYPNDKKLKLHGKISDYSQIVTRGDYHVYNPRREAIEILEVE